MSEGSGKSSWVTPQFFVLSRGGAEESVLLTCKASTTWVASMGNWARCGMNILCTEYCETTAES